MKNALIFGLLWAASAQGQLLLSNGTFDQNINDWQSPSVVPTWVASDGAPASGNGSIQFSDNFNNGSSIYVDSELVPVTPGYRYVLATSYKYMTGSVPNGMSISIEWYDDQENFVGSYPWDAFFNMSQNADQWHHFDQHVENIITDATQARVRLWVHQHSQGTAHNRGRFDDVILFQDTVFVAHFDGQ